ncbi:MAG: HNH endonuclease [Actinomycetales bacterium]|nr:HNH endonuclease [Actinomycetales bacterium]
MVDAAAWDPQDAAPGFADELALLATIDQRARTGHDGYSRDEFGERWADVDGNGCDTRNDVLARDLRDVELRRGTCLVQYGTLHDPYTGFVIDFERGPVTSEAVQIDHLVAMYDAWRTGARDWPAGLRQQLANDPANLYAVDGATNDDKGHSDASAWLPPNREFHCEYVAAQVRIKAAYGLWMTPAEHAASRRVLEGC